MKKALFVAGILLLATDASAALKCPNVENDMERLACYDREAGRRPPKASEPTAAKTSKPASKGKWRVSREKSEFTDQLNVYLSLKSNERVTCRSYGNPERITLTVRCMENTTALYFSGDCHMVSGHNGYGQVEYRIDEQKMKKREFDASTNDRSLGLWRGGSSIPFIKHLIGADKLLLRFMPYSESKITARFDIGGLENAIAPLRKECGW